MVITFFPPNLTAKHQPADQGMIAILKKGYKLTFLRKMLAFFESEYRPSTAQIAAMQNGEKGLDQGHKPHIVDAMKIIKSIWEDNVTMEAIQRCWVKSACLPFAAHSLLANDVGSSERKVAHINRHLPDQLRADIDELCNVVANLSTKMTGDPEFDVRDMRREDLERVMESWCFLEDDPEIEDEMVCDAIAAEATAPRTACLSPSAEPSVVNLIEVASADSQSLCGDKRRQDPLSSMSDPAPKKTKKQTSINHWFTSPSSVSASSIIGSDSSAAATTVSSLTDSTPTHTTLPTPTEPLLVGSLDEYRFMHGIPTSCYGEPTTRRLKPVPRPGDGDCWYHALAWLLNTRDDPVKYRAEIAKEILHYREEYEEGIDGSLDYYVHGITHRRAWADEVEMKAAERLYRRPIVVYNAQWELIRFLSEEIDIGHNPEPLYFLHTGTHENDKHYDALVPIEGSN